MHGQFMSCPGGLPALDGGGLWALDLQLGTKKEALREVFGQTLSELAEEFPNLLVLDGDLANSTRADIFAERQPAKFLEMGIAEQNMMGVAAGLATLGFIPFISTFAAFAVKRAADQVRVVVAQPGLNV